MEYSIKIEEKLSRVVTVKAKAIEEAIDLVEDMYRKEEIVLDYSDFHGDLTIEKKEDIFDSRKDFLINELIQYLIKDEEKHYEELQEPNDHIYLKLLELKEYI